MLPFPRNNDLARIVVKLDDVSVDISYLLVRTPKEDPNEETIKKSFQSVITALEMLKSIPR